MKKIILSLFYLITNLSMDFSISYDNSIVSKIIIFILFMDNYKKIKLDA